MFPWKVVTSIERRAQFKELNNLLMNSIECLSSPVALELTPDYFQSFDFSNVSIDDALRMVCTKLLLKGEAQVLDRIVLQMATQYFKSNPSCHDLFLNIDVVHGVLFSLVLLNTDFTCVSLKKMNQKEYVKNTLEGIEQNVQLDQELLRIWRSNLEITLKELYNSLKENPILFNPNAEPLASAESTRTSSDSVHPVLTRSVSHLNLENAPELLIEGVLYKKHVTEANFARSKNRRWTKVWAKLSFFEGKLELSFCRINTREYFFQEYDLTEDVIYANNSFSGLLKISQPGHHHPVVAKTADYKFAEQSPESISLIHSFALNVDYSDERPNTFTLHLCDGNSYLLQTVGSEGLHAWITIINYCAARKSRTPLRGGLTSDFYGWNVDKNDEKRPTPSRVDSWVIPTPSSRLLCTLSSEVKKEAMFHQIDIIFKEIVLHQSYWEKMRNDPNLDQTAIANWKTRNEYLKLEFLKYEHYEDALGRPSAHAMKIISKLESNGSASFQQGLKSESLTITK